MSIAHDHSELGAELPLGRIHELCKAHGVSELLYCGIEREGHPGPDDRTLFLVMFRDGDFGPWGSKLDEFENDLSRLMHRKVHVASRRGIEQSSNAIRKAQVLGSAKRIL